MIKKKTAVIKRNENCVYCLQILHNGNRFIYSQIWLGRFYKKVYFCLICEQKLSS